MSTMSARSLSARRAWIEIVTSYGRGIIAQTVALRKESVDRNGQVKFAHLLVVGRSPQGERG